MSLFDEILNEPEAKSQPPFELNGDQKRAVAALDQFIQDRRATEFGLFGAAGTGKTSVVGYLFEHHRKREFDSVCLSAPTHKATGVLAEKSGPYIDCSTIHRLLGCRKHYAEDTGEIDFLPDPDREMIGKYEIVVVDECSMIGDTLYSWIMAAAKRRGVKIIWLGDPYQLPPVKDGDGSPCFSVDRSVELTEIMRHKGVIQRSCDGVRQAIIKEKSPPFARAAEDDSGRIIEIEKQIDHEHWSEFFDAFLSDPKGSKALAFKNDDVDFLNSYVRQRLYGDDSAPFVEGERLVMVSTHEPVDGPILHTGSEVTVVEMAEDRVLDLDCYRLLVERDDGDRAVLNVFGDKDQRRKYKKMLDHLRRQGESGGGWKPYFKMKESFGKVRPGYATTIHKSQGSTYGRVFLLQSELRGLWDKPLLARLLYVAYSRARKAIYLI